jgi:sec-independent protein translocase protein TatC
MAESGEMSFLEHLVELRKYMIRALWGVLIAFGIAYYYSNQIFDWLLRPLCEAFHDTAKCPVVYLGVVEPFMVYLKVGLVGGIFLAAPWIFFQIWNFISPGLKSTEKKYVIPFVVTASTMFVGGALLGYYYIFPMAFPFFRDQAGPMIQPMVSMDSYFGFASGLLFAFGALFEIPVFVILLNLIGVLHSQTLWRTWRVAVAIIFVLAAVLTPADPYTMLLLGCPLAGLYLAALAFCSLNDRVRGKKLHATH